MTSPMLYNFPAITGKVADLESSLATLNQLAHSLMEEAQAISAAWEGQAQDAFMASFRKLSNETDALNLKLGTIKDRTNEANISMLTTEKRNSTMFL